MYIVLTESVDLSKFPIGTVVWTEIPFVRNNGRITDRKELKPVIVVEHFPDDSTNVVPVEEYGDKMTAPCKGAINAVMATSYKPDKETGDLRKIINRYDVDLEGHVGEGIYKPCKAVCSFIFNLENEDFCIPCETLEQKYMSQIKDKYDNAVDAGYTPYRIHRR